jgi:hypothetical protein
LARSNTVFAVLCAVWMLVRGLLASCRGVINSQLQLLDWRLLCTAAVGLDTGVQSLQVLYAIEKSIKQ